MSRIAVEVAAVKGTCNAGFEIRDAFTFDGFELIPQGHPRTCGVACASLIASLGRVNLGRDAILVSCPDPATGAGGNVLFKLSRIEDHEDDQG